jgi:hypothetical protein
MIENDRWATEDETRLAIAEEERQRLAQMQDPGSLGLGRLITGIFGPSNVKKRSGAIDTEASPQTRGEK